MKKITVLMAACLATAFAANAANADDAAAGEDLFMKKCKMCHTTGDDGKNGMGPNLLGVVGRAVGTVESYTKYTDAMKATGVTWDEATIDKLLQDPQAFAPGNGMKGGKIKKEDQRAAIIAYLATLK